MHGDFHLVDGALQSEHAGGVGEGGSPLSGARFGGDVRHALLLAVVALGQGRVHFVRPERVRTLVLEVDMSGCADGFLQSVGADERCGAVVLVLVEHLFGYVDPRMLHVKLLACALFGEDGE